MLIKLSTLLICLVSATPFSSQGQSNVVQSTTYGRGLLEQTGATIGSYLSSTNSVVDATPFTVAVIPDTQSLTAFSPSQLTNMINWLTINKAALNLKMVLNLGDMVETNAQTDAGQATVEWDRTLIITNLSRSNIANLLIIGNHDLDNYTTRTYTNFNNRFTTNYFTNQLALGFGGFQSNNFPAEGMYFTQTNSGMRMMFIGLPFWPQDTALTWASNLCVSFSNHSVVITTHSYMNNDNTRMSPGDAFNPSASGIGGSGNDGYQIWQKLVRYHRNIIMVLSGHQLGSGVGRMVSLGDSGNYVWQELINFQSGTSLAGSWGDAIRLLTFYPNLNRVFNSTYSVGNATYLQNGDYQFSQPIRATGDSLNVNRSIELSGITNQHNLLTVLDHSYYVNGIFSNKWSLFRNTNEIGKFYIAYGTNESAASNTVIMTLSSNGAVSINGTISASGGFTDTTINISRLNSDNYYEPMGDDLFLHFPFSECGGVAYTNRTAIVATGAVTSVTCTNGILGWAGSYNGTSSRVSIQTNNLLVAMTNITVSCWFKQTNQTVTQQMLFSQHGGGNDGKFFLAINNDTNVQFTTITTNGAVHNRVDTTNTAGGIAMTNNNWINLVGVYNGVSNLLYINGYLAGQSAQTGPLTNALKPYLVGSYEAGLFFKGEIDEVKLWCRALGTNEVLNLYREGIKAQ